MAILVRTCCCGCDLRTGILLIGIFGLFIQGNGIYSSFRAYKALTDIENEHKDKVEEKLPILHKYFKVVTTLMLANIVLRAISALANLLLLGSYGTLNRYLALPWFFWEIFMLLYTLGGTIFLLVVLDGYLYFLVGAVIGWLLTIYFVLVVYSYIEMLRQDPSAFEIRVVNNVAAPPSYAMQKYP